MRRHFHYHGWRFNGSSGGGKNNISKSIEPKEPLTIKQKIIFFSIIVPISIIVWILANMNGAFPALGILVLSVTNIINYILYRRSCQTKHKLFIILALICCIGSILACELLCLIAADDFPEKFDTYGAIIITKLTIALMIMMPIAMIIIVFCSWVYEINKKEKENEARESIVNNFYQVNKTKLDYLCKQYYSATQRLIESLDDDIYGIFKEQAFWSRLTHKIFVKDFLSKIYVERDGYEEPWSTEEESVTTNEKKVTAFVDGLKEKIRIEWDNHETLNLAVYFIVRYNFIRYKSDFYKLHYGFEDLKAICEYCLKNDENLDSIVRLFTYYWIFQNGIHLSITKTYERISDISKNVYTQIEAITNKEQYFSSQMKEDDSLTNDTVSLIEQIDQMDGRSFEVFIAQLFEKRGYKVTLTKSTGDYGVDVIIENDFLKIGIQTKCYTQKVGNAAIQEAVTGLKHYKLDKAMVVTNNYFTSSAIQLAKENNVILWDRNTLITEINPKSA